MNKVSVKVEMPTSKNYIGVNIGMGVFITLIIVCILNLFFKFIQFEFSEEWTVFLLVIYVVCYTLLYAFKKYKQTN